MVNKRFWLGMLVLVLIFGMSVIGCNKLKNVWGSDATTKNLSGEYILDDKADHGYKSFTFYEDGTGLLDIGRYGIEKIDYKVNGKKVVIEVEGIGMVFEINGNVLRYSDDKSIGPWIKK
jgi:hypothetical protein